MCLGSAIVLTGKGYKEHHWLVIPHQPLWLSSFFTTSTIMSMSSCSIPNTQDQYSRSHATVRVCGQASTRTNAGRAITPFMFNEEEYQVSVP